MFYYSSGWDLLYRENAKERYVITFIMSDIVITKVRKERAHLLVFPPLITEKDKKLIRKLMKLNAQKKGTRISVDKERFNRKRKLQCGIDRSKDRP